jgi:hypothetical protein
MKQSIKTVATHDKVMTLITQGKSRKDIIQKLQEEEGLAYKSAVALYYGALRDVIPNPEFYDDYKKAVVQHNIDRLEQIIDSSIDGNAGDKNAAIKASDVMNKLVGAYGENQVNIARNDKGDEVIQITFGK